MVNFICQLDWATGCLNIWSNVILGVLDETNLRWCTEQSRLSSLMLEVSFSLLRAWVGQNVEEGGILPLRLIVLELGHWPYPTVRLGLELELTPPPLLGLDFQTQTRTIPSSLLVLDFSTFMTAWANFLE